MHAIVVHDDDTRTMAWEEVPTPSPEPGEVLIRVHTTAVNRADLLQRGGRYAPPPGASKIIGLECAGVVESVGDGVDASLVGRRVASLLGGGGYGEFATTHASHLLFLPDDMTFETAGAIPEVFYTAFLNLCIEGQLQPGEHAMIHAAASGVGTAGLQICREMGCPVVATASGEKLDALVELGATTTVDRKSASFKDAVHDVTDGRGVDVILDPVAANYLGDNVDCLALRGRLVIIGLLSGTRAELDMASVLRRRLRVVGSVLRSRSRDEKTQITEAFKQQVWPWLCEGKIEPIIETVLPIQEVEAAHDLIKSNATTGKVVLRVR